MRGRTNQYWPQYHVTRIQIWNERYNCVIQGIQFPKNGHLRDNTPYMQWYIRHSIRYIMPPQPSCWKLFWLKYKRGGELDFKTF